MTEKEKLALLEEMLELDEGSLSPETSLESINEWDSVAALSLIVLMDEEFGRQLTGKEIKDLKYINDILSLMEK
ncbi:MAG: phosphopantetheine-binding protein [Acetivibrionales bacterium]